MHYGHALVAVLKDLWHFTRLPLLLGARPTVLRLSSAPTALALPGAVSAVATPVAPVFPLHEVTRGYVCVPQARIYTSVTPALDTVVQMLPYAAALSVRYHEGQCTYVTTSDGHEGFVRKDDITYNRQDIWPELTPGVVYDAHHADTGRIRRVIDDAFGAELLLLPLLGIEYVTYRLRAVGRSLPWGSERPRLPGQWQTLLLGVRGVSIGSTPHTGAVAEYVEAEEAMVAYVESVAPDGSVILSTVCDGEGKFMRTAFSAADCRVRLMQFITSA